MSQHPQPPTWLDVACRYAVQAWILVAKHAWQLCQPDALGCHLQHHTQRISTVYTPRSWKVFLDPGWPRPSVANPSNARAFFTVGIATIADQAKSAAMILSGDHKRHAFEVITQATCYDPDWPATIISECKNAALFVDALAAGMTTA